MRSIASLVVRAQEAAAASTAEIRLLRLADLRQAVDAAMVATLTEVDVAPGLVHLDGAVDGGRWLAARTELHPAEARGLAVLAGALPAMPATSDALEQGRIGTEKARLLSTAREVDAFADAEADLVDQVVGVSLRTARRVVGRFLAEHRPAGPGDPAANEVTLSPKRNGRWKLHGDLDTDSAMLLGNELRRLAAAYRDDETLSSARRTALALVEVARRSVTLGERAAASRPEVVLVADVTFGDVVNPGYDDGTPLGRRAFENLSCDATVRRLLTDGPNEPLELGRSVRLATQGQRRAAAVRDGGCVFPGCDRPPDDCDLHHIRHWLNGGTTDLANLCLVCRRHHSLTHSIGFTFVRHKDGRLTIHRPDGTALRWPGEQAA